LYEFQAILDPVIQLSPCGIYYHGEDVPSSSLYSLSFSPEIENSAPEPAALTLAAAGLIVLGAAGKFRRRSQTY